MINMYLQILLRLNLIIVFLLLIRKMVGNKLRKKFVYGLWIVVPVFLLSFPFVRVPQLFHWEMNMGKIFQLKEKEVAPQEFANSSVSEKLSDPTQKYNLNPGEVLKLYEQQTENEILNQNENLNLSELRAQKEILNLDEVLAQNEVLNGNDGLDQYEKVQSVANTLTPANGIKLSTIVGVVYLGIVGILLLCMILSNVLFHNSCKKKRIFLRKSEDAGLAVYHLEGIASPFLMGKTIYLPTYMVEEEQIRYAILHEESHYLHGDAFWVIVRYIVLAIYFYDPIICLAFFASGHDCELACDEEVLGKIGAEESSAYGACLLGSLEQKFHKAPKMVMTTNMSTGKKFMKERIVNIANKKKKSRITMAIAAFIMVTVVGCSFEKSTEDTSEQESLVSETEEIKTEVTETEEIKSETTKTNETKTEETSSEQVAETVSGSTGENKDQQEKLDAEQFDKDQAAIDYAKKIPDIGKVNLAYELGEFDSVSELSDKEVITSMFQIVNSRTTDDPDILKLYPEQEYVNYCIVHIYDEEAIKKAAKDLLNVDIKGVPDDISETDVSSYYRDIYYKDGKYIWFEMPADGETLTFKNISNKGDVYTYYTDCCLDSEFVDVRYYDKNEAVIKDGVIISSKLCTQNPDLVDNSWEEDEAGPMLTLSDVEQKNLEAAFYLTNAQGDFANTSKIDPKQILLTLLTVTEGEKVSDDALYDLFDRKETDSQNVIQYNEDDLKKAAKELLGLELPKYEDQFENIKYKDGKYYMLGCRMKWQEWPYAGALYADIDVDMNNIPFGNFWIEGIGKDGDIYTFKGRTCHLMNDYSYVNEFAYEVVIKDGTLISGKKIKLVD